MTKRSVFVLVLLGIVASGAALAEEPHWNGPVLINESRVSPSYPPAALQAKLDGVVTVSAQILADGTVGEIELVETSVAKLGFEDAAKDAVRQWRFEPATLDGATMEAHQLVRLHFRAGPTRMNPGFVATSFGVQTMAGSATAAASVGIGKAGGAGLDAAGMVRASQQARDSQGRRKPNCEYATCAFSNVNDIRDRGPKDVIIRLYR